MKQMGIVYGSKEQAKELIIGKDTVYVHSNIQLLENQENGGETYQYEETQYTLSEYLELVQNINTEIYNTGYEQALLDLAQLEV